MPQTDAERMINLGVTVDTKKLGKVTVKELSLEQLLRVSKDVIALVTSVDFGESSGTSTAAIVKILSSDKAAEPFKEVMAAATGKPVEDFTDLGVSDWLKLFVAFKKVTDFAEIKDLFLELIPSETWTDLRQNLASETRKQG